MRSLLLRTQMKAMPVCSDPVSCKIRYIQYHTHIHTHTHTHTHTHCRYICTDLCASNKHIPHSTHTCMHTHMHAHYTHKHCTYHTSTTLSFSAQDTTTDSVTNPRWRTRVACPVKVYQVKWKWKWFMLCVYVRCVHVCACVFACMYVSVCTYQSVI